MSPLAGVAIGSLTVVAKYQLQNGGSMSLETSVRAFNQAFQPAIKISELTRDGRITAQLPRVNQEIIIKGSTFNPDVKVTSSDLAWFCEETRRAMAPGLALLQNSLSELTKQQP